MQYNKIQVNNSTPGIFRITLNDGKGNILDAAMMRELREVLSAARADVHCKALVIDAAGKHFSFGASVEEHQRDQAAAMIGGFNELILDVARFPAPVIARVSGYCLGGAMELVLAAHMVFADASAVFGQPEIQLGVFPPPASLLLPMRIGFARAEEMLISGANISAMHAHQCGLINHLFDGREELEIGMMLWIEKNILGKSAAALRFAIRAERMRLVEELETYLPRMEKMYVEELMASHDANEGITSFLEKRKPVWKDN